MFGHSGSANSWRLMAAQVMRPLASCCSTKIRLIQSAHAGDGLVRVLANLIAEFQEAALLFEVRVVGRGNGVLQTGMVRQRYMEAGHTGIGQQRYKNTSSDSTTPALP